MKKQKKVLDIIATTENISVINILLILNPKHSSYREENKLYSSQNQDIQESRTSAHVPTPWEDKRQNDEHASFLLLRLNF